LQILRDTEGRYAALIAARNRSPRSSARCAQAANAIKIHQPSHDQLQSTDLKAAVKNILNVRIASIASVSDRTQPNVSSSLLSLFAGERGGRERTAGVVLSGGGSQHAFSDRR
jgi:hypothetical protein